ARERRVPKPAQEKPSTLPPTLWGESAGAAAVFPRHGRGRSSSSDVRVGTPNRHSKRAEAEDAPCFRRTPRSMLAPRGTPRGTPRSMLLSRALH
ncbi:unnamed protein product, partial [Ectocarpus sp. 8 AP-2014]